MSADSRQPLRTALRNPRYVSVVVYPNVQHRELRAAPRQKSPSIRAHSLPEALADGLTAHFLRRGAPRAQFRNSPAGAARAYSNNAITSAGTSPSRRCGCCAIRPACAFLFAYAAADVTEAFPHPNKDCRYPTGGGTSAANALGAGQKNFFGELRCLFRGAANPPQHDNGPLRNRHRSRYHYRHGPP